MVCYNRFTDSLLYQISIYTRVCYSWFSLILYIFRAPFPASPQTWSSSAHPPAILARAAPPPSSVTASTRSCLRCHTGASRRGNRSQRRLLSRINHRHHPIPQVSLKMFSQFSLPQIRCSVVEGHFFPGLRMCKMNSYSCHTFNKLILASINIIHRRPQNS